MGTVKIESATRDKKFIMELESDNLCAINCLAGKVECLDTIRDICIAEEIILIREENNVNAYDWAGNHLWNIGELVGDIKMAFDGISHITPAEAKREFGIKVKRNARCLFRCVAGGFVFVIDAENRKMLCKAAGRAK